jgi:hypothetical protein
MPKKKKPKRVWFEMMPKPSERRFLSTDGRLVVLYRCPCAKPFCPAKDWHGGQRLL